MNKKIILILVIFSIFFFSLNSVNAYYAWSHRYWDLKSISEVNSPITQQCGGDRLAIILDGESGADIPVLHYNDDKFTSYVFTHTFTGSITECFTEAGNDLDLQCDCHGKALHNIQDHYSHTEDTLVPKYLKKSFMPNLGGHMTVENDFEKKHRIYLRDVVKDNLVLGGQVDFFDSAYLDTYFTDEKYILLLNEVAGIDLRNDLNIIANGYKGKGFYDTVYNQKLKLPWWFWGISIGMIILGFGIMFLLIFTGKTSWKWLAILPWFIIGIVGSIILIAFFTNSTWNVINSALTIPTSIGLLDVSDEDIKFYNEIVIEKSKEYLRTGVMPFPDNSGLSYTDNLGTRVRGALSAGETNFKYILLPILSLFFVLINMLLFIKTYSTKPAKGVNKALFISLISFIIVIPPDNYPL